MKSKKEIKIIGAGLVGSLFALQMAQKGHKVSLIEKRPDMRKNIIDGGRSINLIVTSRGINALRKVGIEKEILKLTVPVTGRMIHDLEGTTKYQPYGRDKSECNFSISRLELNKKLLDLAEASGVNIFFDQEIDSINIQNSKEIIFGADGGGSLIRKSLSKILELNNIDHKNYSESLGVAYKELMMPSKKGEYPIEKNALHIWPRGNHMLMALPNRDGSFTMTLYMPEQGEISFEKLNSRGVISRYLNHFYKSALPYMPNILEEWERNPVGKLATVRCDQWIWRDKTCLIGDAAHGIVPFFGQGMNSGFEDCALLNDLYEKYDGEFLKMFKDYQHIQVPNAWAIADMAIENYTEMSEKVADDRFLLKKQVEHAIEQAFPELYRSRYGMITYTLIPYDLAKKAGIIQNKILDQLITSISSIEELDIELAKILIEEKLVPFLSENHINIKRFT